MLAWETARAEAGRVLEAYWEPDKFPVDPFVIARRMSITTWETHHFSDDVSGEIVQNSPEDVTIYVNANHAEARQAFTCAHELGHYVDRTFVADDPEYSFTDKRGQKYDLHEFFADEFAGALLMPEVELRSMIQDGYSDMRIAAHFAVSLPAVRRRIRVLDERPSNVVA